MSVVFIRTSSHPGGQGSRADNQTENIFLLSHPLTRDDWMRAKIEIFLGSLTKIEKNLQSGERVTHENVFSYSQVSHGVSKMTSGTLWPSATDE